MPLNIIVGLDFLAWLIGLCWKPLSVLISIMFGSLLFELLKMLISFLALSILGEQFSDELFDLCVRSLS